MGKLAFRRLRIGRDERGITGLETAIVLIAFVVVASVFAFAVLSTGLLSSEKSKETVLGGLSETSATITLKGAVIGRRMGGSSATTTATTHFLQIVEFQVAPAAGSGTSVDLASTAVVVTYIDDNQSVNVRSGGSSTLGGWYTEWLSGSSPLLDANERVQISVNLDGLLSPTLQENTEFTIQVKPNIGATLIVTKTTPAEITPVVNMQ
jgi:flagellin FlaB